ncbi:MAG: C1 family peptidase [Solobacterium sp.]|nr:C1 family peptidase [Solobacterium sp.]
MSITKDISPVQLEQMRNDYLENEKARIVRNALTKNDIGTISCDFVAARANPYIFSIDIETMPVTNQKASGRCWIFSALNVLREIIAKKYQIKEFELSQNYVAFYDKLEKVNFYLEAVLQESKVASMHDETIRFLMETAVGDGGQWDMFVSLVKKYGICPKAAMPETYQSSHTRGMNALINQRLHRFTAEVFKLKDSGTDEELGKLKEECLKECYGLICSCFGMPPESFAFEYRDKDGKYHCEQNVRPQDFYEKYLGTDMDEYVGIINGPTADKPFWQMYTVKYLGNVIGGNPVSFLNLPMDRFKELILDQLKAGELVWFGCDCGKDGDRKTGLWDDRQFRYEETFDMNLDMSKEDMLDTRHSAMNHAMVLTGVNLENDRPTRWKIENSWGEEPGNKGYFICSDTWFDRYVYEAVVHRKYLSEKELAILQETPHMLEPWDPFGSLAD